MQMKEFYKQLRKDTAVIKAIILKEDNGNYELELETRIEDKDYIS